MSDKEMLEEIKNRFKWGKENLENATDNLSDNDVKWLIKQSEKVEVLKIEKEQMQNDIMFHRKKADEYLDKAEQLEKENEHSNNAYYKMDQALVKTGKEIIDRENQRAEMQYIIDRYEQALKLVRKNATSGHVINIVNKALENK
jgi:hypothetical protein